MNEAFLNEVGERQSSLSPAEARVATWILNNPGEAVDASVQTVAAHAAVSEPTVVRFCRSMGLKGYRDLKTQLIASLQKTESYLHHDVAMGDAPTTAAVKVLESAINSLVDLRQQIFSMPFEAASDKLITARQVVFAGLGASGHVAADSSHKFFRLGIPCVLALDSPTMLQQAAVSRPGDVFIAISHSGAWPALIESMKIAGQRGVEIIALTDPSAPLAETASLIFPCHADEDTNVYTPMSSRLAQLTVLDALQVSVALKMGAAAEDNLRSAKAALTTRSDTWRR